MSVDIKPGDMIGVSGRGSMSNLIQVGCLSLPNVGPLGRWGLAGLSHVAIVAPVFGEMIVYESTSFNRPPCLRTGRENPTGVQAHRLTDILDGGGDVFHYPLRRPLYVDEEDRLLNVLESCLGRGYDFVGAGRAGGGRIMRCIQRWTYKHENMNHIFCNELVAYCWAQIGIMQCRNAGAGNPTSLARHAVRRGICTHPTLIT
jgi:hypothetical protein